VAKAQRSAFWPSFCLFHLARVTLSPTSPRSRTPRRTATTPRARRQRQALSPASGGAFVLLLLLSLTSSSSSSSLPSLVSSSPSPPLLLAHVVLVAVSADHEAGTRPSSSPQTHATPARSRRCAEPRRSLPPRQRRRARFCALIKTPRLRRADSKPLERDPSCLLVARQARQTLADEPRRGAREPFQRSRATSGFRCERRAGPVFFVFFRFFEGGFMSWILRGPRSSGNIAGWFAPGRGTLLSGIE